GWAAGSAAGFAGGSEWGAVGGGAVAAGSAAVGGGGGWAGGPHAEGCAGGEDGDGDEECGGGRPRQVCAGAGGDVLRGHASSSSGRANQTPSGQDHSPSVWPAAGSCPGSSSHWCHAPSRSANWAGQVSGSGAGGGAISPTAASVEVTVSATMALPSWARYLPSSPRAAA